MLEDPLRPIIQAQLARHAAVLGLGTPELGLLLERALEPDDVRRALLKETPLLRARRALGPPVEEEPHVLRERALLAGALVVGGPEDLAFRRLYPALDVGVYCASHAMGKPSAAWLPALEEHLGQLLVHGTAAWVEGGWLNLFETFQASIRALLGDDEELGDVTSFLNYSDGLSALLGSGLTGTLLTTDDHFTSAHYVHQAWAERTGSDVIRVPAGGLVDALTPGTAIVSVSTAAWKTGVLLDVFALAEEMMDVCPGAVLLLDAYQTLGTVPLSVGRLPPRCAVLGGGLKQLRAGTGSGFAWISGDLLDELEPDRTGWWAHREPLAFSPEFEAAEGAAKLRTGVPDPTPLVALITELQVLASSGRGSLDAAVRRARGVTTTAVHAGMQAAEALGLEIEGPGGSEDRGAFFAIRVPRGGAEAVQELASVGVFVDFRADAPGAEAGVVRISASPATFVYEVVFAVSALAEVIRDY